MKQSTLCFSLIGISIKITFRTKAERSILEEWQEMAEILWHIGQDFLKFPDPPMIAAAVKTLDVFSEKL